MYVARVAAAYQMAFFHEIVSSQKQHMSPSAFLRYLHPIDRPAILLDLRPACTTMFSTK
jgi:hypothetical protein